MNNNLKTFPVKSTPQRYEAWKKRFEKELREMIDTEPQDAEWLKEAEITAKVVKEILGE